MLQTLADLQEERFVLIQYLNAKARTEDWHGVADAAMDLRELDVKLKYESEKRVVEDISAANELSHKTALDMLFEPHNFIPSKNFDTHCAQCGCEQSSPVHV